MTTKHQPIFSDRIDRIIEALCWAVMSAGAVYFGIHLLLAAARVLRG